MLRIHTIFRGMGFHDPPLHGSLRNTRGKLSRSLTTCQWFHPILPSLLHNILCCHSDFIRFDRCGGASVLRMANVALVEQEAAYPRRYCRSCIVPFNSCLPMTRDLPFHIRLPVLVTDSNGRSYFSDLSEDKHIISVQQSTKN